ncbi:amidase [Fusarium avenaceum]|nr:amidase [Fusarium avenaceum]
MVSADWQALIQQKRTARDERIPKEWRIPETLLSKVSSDSPVSAFDLLKEAALLTPEEVEITEEHDATGLVQKMASGELSAYQVTHAFCKRAAVAHQLTNSLTEIFFEKALDQARSLDAYFNETGKTKGPLHGLPISLKDMINVKGEFGTMGFVSFLKEPAAAENSVIVDVLGNAGAIFFCKTNVPQTLLLSLTPGGSSSGEGALVGLRGSPLGVGTDMGGSIRAPSMLNGIFGFKPTAGRMPWAKQQNLIPKGWASILPTLGPMGHSARDLTLFTKTVIQSRPWLRDATALAIPWHDAPKKKSLTIGLWLGDPAFPVSPPITRALTAAREKLKQAGHDIKVLQSAPAVLPGTQITMRSFSLDFEGVVFKYLAAAEEAPIPDLAATAPQQWLPEGHVADLKEVWNVNAAVQDYREEWMKVWRDGDLDVLLCPASRTTAVPHGQFGPVYYTMLWNLLDFPSSVIPLGKADASLDSKDGYDATEVDGAPAGVQVVGWRFQDEHVLSATETIADALKA